MKNKASNQFLLWTYFKLDGSEYGPDIVNVAIAKAYIDATNQGAYKTIVAKGHDQDKLKNTAIFTTFAALHKLKEGLDFAKWHEETCSELVGVFKDVKANNKPTVGAFTYGNAQKLVNMSIKNLYVIKYCYRPLSNSEYDFDSWYDSRLKPYETQFQIPLDNYVLQYIYKDINNNHSHCGEAEGITIKQINHEYYKILFKNGNEYAWSKIPNYCLYKLIQQAIIDYYQPNNPLEWENAVWISIAKERNTSRKKNLD